jgi:hypothetical protein
MFELLFDMPAIISSTVWSNRTTTGANSMTG